MSSTNERKEAQARLRNKKVASRMQPFPGGTKLLITGNAGSDAIGQKIAARMDKDLENMFLGTTATTNWADSSTSAESIIESLAKISKELHSLPVSEILVVVGNWYLDPMKVTIDGDEYIVLDVGTFAKWRPHLQANEVPNHFGGDLPIREVSAKEANQLMAWAIYISDPLAPNGYRDTFDISQKVADSIMAHKEPNP